MTKVTVVYLRVFDGGEETTIGSNEEVFHGDHLPRLGEEIYIDGASRTVARMRHYSDSVQLFAYSTVQYEYLTEQDKEAMDRLDLDPDD